ncbi:MAG: outer membrane protein assembly factor BamE [Acetobacter sp.]
MKKFTAMGCLSALLLVAACGSSGNESIKNETAATVDQKIQDGVTTKAQVKTAYGDPLETSFTDSGHEIWKYVFERTHANGTNFIPYYGAVSRSYHGKAKTLTIIFNDNTVWHHTLSDSDVKIHDTGIGIGR